MSISRDSSEMPGGVQIEQPGVIGYQPDAMLRKRPRRRSKRLVAFATPEAKQRAEDEGDVAGEAYSPSSGEQRQ